MAKIKNISCPICHHPCRLLWRGNIRPSRYFSREHNYQITSGARPCRLPAYQCPACSHVFSPLPLSNQQLSLWYKESRPDCSFLQESHGRTKTAQKILAAISSFPLSDSRSLLDIGCGPGIFLAAAKKAGWQVSGLEPSSQSVKYARSALRLPDIIQGNIDNLVTFPDSSLDVITTFDVLEHLPNPAILINESARLLKKGGIFVITTPQVDSLLALLMRSRWYAVFPEHLHYFSRRSITQLLAEHGFSIVKSKHHTRYFSINYLLKRLLQQLNLPSFSMPWSPIIPANFFDEFEIYARKQK